ncbi:MAG: NPCBM/NEW2 domain-containing protein [Planctomycetota bacterium]
MANSRQLAAQEVIRRLDGARFRGQVLAIDASGTLRYTAPPTELTTVDAKLDLDISRLDDLLSIRFSASANESTRSKDSASSVKIELRDGSRLRAASVKLNEERLGLTGGLFRGSLALSIDAVGRIVWAEADSLPPSTDVLWRPSADQDRLIMRDGDSFRAIAGIVESLDGERVVLDVDGEQRMLPRARVAALVFAAPELPAVPPATRELRLADGSYWKASRVSLDEHGWTLEAHGWARDAKVELPREAVAELAVSSPRLRWLADLTPREADQRAMLAWPLPWRRDHSVSGGPLTMNGIRFARGLGMQAGTRLVFEPPPDAAWFVATLGLDDAARHRGDCVVVVRQDEEQHEPLARLRLRGGERPRELLVPLVGHKRLTLVVEPGVGFDIGDHVDWGDARLILSKSVP